MSKLVVALYETVDLAQSTVKELKNADIKGSHVDVIKNADAEHQGFFKGLFSSGGDDDRAEAEKSLNKLTDMGVERTDAESFAAGVRDGCSMIIVQSDDPNTIDQARRIMDRNAISNVSERYGASGHARTTTRRPVEQTTSMRKDRRPGALGSGEETRPEPALGATAGPQASASKLGKSHHDQRGGKKLQAAEEELQVGKREVEGGGVRASTRVTETPVEEDIHLRDEKVHVERRKVDRPAESGDHVFEEESIEFSEMHEEPVVSKSTHVTEEVIVGKEVEERTETIRDTVRRQEIDIEELRQAGDTGRYSQFKNDFDQHYETNFAGRGNSREDYQLGYRYGMALAEHGNYRNQNWKDVEPHARKGWEARNAGTWNDFQDSVRYGWDRIRGEGSQEQPSSRI